MSQDDPFAPPPDAKQGPIELAGERPQRPAAPPEDEPLPMPEKSKPVSYRKPKSFGLGTFLLVGLALVGVGAIALQFKAKMIASVPALDSVLPKAGPTPTQATDPTQTTASLPSATAPKPTVYKPLPTSDDVLITIRTTPPGARILVRGQPAESNPLRMPRSSFPYVCAATLTGYGDEMFEIVPDKSKTITVTLQPPH